MTIEELQVIVASHEREWELIRDSFSQLLRVASSHERQLELIRDSLRTQGELFRIQGEEHDREMKKRGEEHDREMKELRGIVSEIGVMLKTFIASMQGGIKNGDAS